MTESLGVQDLGGSRLRGAVPYAPHEPAFHSDWERRVFGTLMPVLRAIGSTPGEFRHTIERLDPADYFDNGYFGRWLAALELLAVERGLVDSTALGSAAVARAAPSVAPASQELPEPAAGQTIEGRPARRVTDVPPRFATGQAVRIVAPQHQGHTRRAAYTFGRTGHIVEIHPCEVLPDASAHRLAERAVWVYTVSFDAAELWGDEAEPGVTVMIDAYEPYLTPIDEETP